MPDITHRISEDGRIYYKMKMNMKKIFYILAGLMLPIALLVGCTPEAVAPLDLDGDTWLLELKVGGYEAEIDSKAKTAVISVPETFDDSKMTVESIVVSDGQKLL